MNNKNTDIMKNQYGSSYEGKVVNGIPHGKGIITYPKGDIYEGDMKRGLRHGKGTMTSPDGYKYEGEFRNDKQKNGLGTMTFPDGNIKSVVVKNDEFIMCCSPKDIINLIQKSKSIN